MGSAGELLAEGAEATVEAAFRTGDYTIAETALRRARDEVTDRATEAAVLDRLGWLEHFQALDRDADGSRADQELALFTGALEIHRELRNLGGAAAALFGIGLVHQVLRDDWTTAIASFRDALALAEHADLITRSEIHRHVGFYYLVENVQPDKAVEHLSTSLDLRHEYGDARWVPSGMQALGWAMLAAGRQDEAVALIREALEHARAAGLRESRVARLEKSLRLAETGEPG